MFAAAVGRVKPNEEQAQKWLEEHKLYQYILQAMYVAMEQNG